MNIDKPGGKLTLEISADQAVTARIGASEQEEFGWVLYPPKLYLRAVPFVQDAGIVLLEIDEQLLDEYDIGLYMLAHHDIVGTAELTATTFAFTGLTQLDGIETHLAIRCVLPG